MRVMASDSSTQNTTSKVRTAFGSKINLSLLCPYGALNELGAAVNIAIDMV